MNDRDIMPADPEYRRKVFRIVILIVVLGLLALSLITPKLDKLVNAEHPEKLLTWLTVILIALLLIPAGMAVYLIRIAILTLRQRQYPPEGLKLLRDTPILYEEEAKKRAILLIFASVMIIDLCVFMAIIALKLFASLL